MKHYVRFKLSKFKYGEIFFPNKITIDLCDTMNPIKTYLHELIHMEHPDWLEKKVLKVMERRWNRMSTRQRFELGKKLFNRKWR